MDDLYYMDQALALAREAAEAGEVPVGCVIVRGSEIVGRGRNRRETDKTALGHAEIQSCRIPPPDVSLPLRSSHAPASYKRLPASPP